MNSLFRSAAFISTLIFTYWMGAALLMLTGAPEPFVLVASGAISVTTAQLVARFVGRRAESPEFVRTVALGAVLTGTVGFILGFFGPLLFSPKSNQGPLLGLFITGPLGVLLGAIGGAAYWTWRRPRGCQS
jgi:Kef-type K+ transport system membrane component KefB